MHRIDGGANMDALAASTKTAISASLIHSLRDMGRASAKAWLAKHFHALGTECTVNIMRDYLDDLRVPV